MIINGWQKCAMFNTILLKVEKEKSNNIGTGFLFDYEFENNIIPFIVTNRHVIEDYKFIKAVFHKRATDLNDCFTVNSPSGSLNIDKYNYASIDMSSNEVFFHKNKAIDLAFISCNSIIKRNDLALVPFSQKMILDWENSSIPPGASLLFFGYPKELMEKTHHLPIVRTANMASLSEVDFDGKPEFLLDGVVWPGSSGSPVFIEDKNKDSFSMVGVIYEYKYFPENGNLRTNLSLGTAIKSSEIISCIEDVLFS